MSIQSAFAEQFACSKYFAQNKWPEVCLNETPVHRIKGNPTMVFYMADPEIRIEGKTIVLGNDKATFDGKAGKDIYLLTSGFTGASSATVSPRDLAFDVDEIKPLIRKHGITHIAVKILDWQIISDDAPVRQDAAVTQTAAAVAREDAAVPETVAAVPRGDIAVSETVRCGSPRKVEDAQ